MLAHQAKYAKIENIFCIFPLHGKIGSKWGQEHFFLLIQTLPTFWAERILISIIFIFWIFWLPNFWLGHSLGPPTWARHGPTHLSHPLGPPTGACARLGPPTWAHPLGPGWAGGPSVGPSDGPSDRTISKPRLHCARLRFF